MSARKGKAQHLTTGDVACYAGISQQTVIRCFDTGQLKGFRVPGSRFRRVPVAACYDFLVASGIPTSGLVADYPELAGRIPEPAAG